MPFQCSKLQGNSADSDLCCFVRMPRDFKGSWKERSTDHNVAGIIAKILHRRKNVGKITSSLLTDMNFVKAVGVLFVSQTDSKRKLQKIAFYLATFSLPSFDGLLLNTTSPRAQRISWSSRVNHLLISPMIMSNATKYVFSR